MKLQLPMSSETSTEPQEPSMGGNVQDVLDRLRSIQIDTDQRAEKWLDRLDRYTDRMR